MATKAAIAQDATGENSDIVINGFKHDPAQVHDFWANLVGMPSRAAIKEQVNLWGADLKTTSIGIDLSKATPKMFFYNVEGAAPDVTGYGPVAKLAGNKFLIVHDAARSQGAGNDLDKPAKIKTALKQLGVEDRGGDIRAAILRVQQAVQAALPPAPVACQTETPRAAFAENSAVTKRVRAKNPGEPVFAPTAVIVAPPKPAQPNVNATVEPDAQLQRVAKATPRPTLTDAFGGARTRTEITRLKTGKHHKFKVEYKNKRPEFNASKGRPGPRGPGNRQ